MWEVTGGNVSGIITDEARHPFRRCVHYLDTLITIVDYCPPTSRYYFKPFPGVDVGRFRVKKGGITYGAGGAYLGLIPDEAWRQMRPVVCCSPRAASFPQNAPRPR